MGTLVLAPLLNHLIDSYSWRGAMFILGAIMANTAVAGMTYRQTCLEQMGMTRKRKVNKVSTSVSSHFHKSIAQHDTDKLCHFQKQNNRRGDKTCCRKIQSLNRTGIANIFSSRRFVIFSFAVFLKGFATYTYVDYSVARALYAGIDKTSASFLLSLIGLSGMVTSATHGFLIEWKIISCGRLYTLALVLSGVACFMNPVVQSYAGLAVSASLFGAGYGVSMPVMLVMTRDIVSLDNIKASYSIIVMVFQLGMMTESPLNGN